MKSFPPVKVWNFAVYGHVHALISMMCYISASMKTGADVLVVFVCILYNFFWFSFFIFLFCFSKVSNIKDRLDFYHLHVSHKLHCLFV